MPSICSAIGTTGFGQWIWYRSITSTPSRSALLRPCFSTSTRVGAIGSTLVARNASLRRPPSARPTMRLRVRRARRSRRCRQVHAEVERALQDPRRPRCRRTRRRSPSPSTRTATCRARSPQTRAPLTSTKRIAAAYVQIVADPSAGPCVRCSSRPAIRKRASRENAKSGADALFLDIEEPRTPCPEDDARARPRARPRVPRRPRRPGRAHPSTSCACSRSRRG